MRYGAQLERLIIEVLVRCFTLQMCLLSSSEDVALYVLGMFSTTEGACQGPLHSAVCWKDEQDLVRRWDTEQGSPPSNQCSRYTSTTMCALYLHCTQVIRPNVARRAGLLILFCRAPRRRKAFRSSEGGSYGGDGVGEAACLTSLCPMALDLAHGCRTVAAWASKAV